jgi:hypothetical protein
LYIGGAESVIGPVADGDADEIEARLSNLIEVVPVYPRVPMRSQNLQSALLAELLPQSVFVDNVVAVEMFK